MTTSEFTRFDHNFIVVAGRDDILDGLTTVGMERHGLDFVMLDKSGGDLISSKRIDGNTGREMNIHVLICPHPRSLTKQLIKALNGIVNHGEKCLVHLAIDLVEMHAIARAAHACLDLGHEVVFH